MGLVADIVVEQVSSFSITADEVNQRGWIERGWIDDFDTPVGLLKAIEATINVRQITPSIISSLDTVHKYCVDPHGKEDFSSSVFDFPFTLLWHTQPGSPIRRIYDDENPIFISSTLTLAASLATSVTFPTSLAQDNVIPAFYFLLPKLVFTSARTLTLQPATDTDNPLPEPLLFSLGRIFPAVRCVDLGKAHQLAEEAVVNVIDDLPSLRVARFARPPGFMGRVPIRRDSFFLPSYLRSCSGDGPLLQVKGAFQSRFDGSESWSLWEGEGEGEEEEDESSEEDSASEAEVPVGQTGGTRWRVEHRIRRISVYFSAGYAPEPEGIWLDRPAFTDLFDTCIKAITALPKLERITLTTDDPFPGYLLHECGWCGVGNRLSLHGFDAVQAGPCSVELYRDGQPITEGQRLITDYFSRVDNSNEMVD
ncbi:unnamed protein product [Vitrella brassicaformis CCMP3155]|uniref:Uncharacterized protein n=1 Tax=Vitrella brassicaformis (strain CCMP3155) TaxID=1169540 RepID=A0A0G4ELJ4_VITBC|nr:unnamed protein product [Vitrella brassicaformis CCMP3155]|eukprot:CEL97879.1 unnamed protein product [Vitrella brassicaformis CCMP3155]